MKKVLNYLTSNALILIFIIVLTALFVQKCNQPSVPQAKPDTVTKVIEVHHYHDSIVVKEPTIINKIIPKPSEIPESIKADTNYNRLKVQYDSLVQEHFSKNIYSDSLKIDSIGIITTTDTVSQNNIQGRSYDYHFDVKERIIERTITLPPKLRNQVYIGGSILGDELHPLGGIEGGFLLKNKRDHIYQLKLTKIFNQSQPIYSIGYYPKIKFHK